MGQSIGHSEDTRLNDIGTDSDLETLIRESVALVCEFCATRCCSCKALEPILDRLEKAYPDITFVRVDVEEHQDLSDKHRVRYVPTLFFVSRGEIIKRIEGWSNYEMLEKIAMRLLSES
jgi:thioredoxin 1